MTAQILPFIPRNVDVQSSGFIVYAGVVSTRLHCTDEDQVIDFINQCLERGLMQRHEAQMVLEAHKIDVVWEETPEPEGAA